MNEGGPGEVILAGAASVPEAAKPGPDQRAGGQGMLRGSRPQWHRPAGLRPAPARLHRVAAPRYLQSPKRACAAHERRPGYASFTADCART
jgi:hypothetical protein